jgi:hypothetical protein
MVNVDEDVEHEQEEARPERALVIGKDGVDEARGAFLILILPRIPSEHPQRKLPQKR